MKIKLSLLLPFLIFAVVAVILWRGLNLHPNRIPSPLINKPAPAFSLPNLLNQKMLTQNDFKDKVTLLNVWATWCAACADENEFLLHLAQTRAVKIIGLDYKDDNAAAKKWLAEYGNPFSAVATDIEGKVAINYGVYGTPETFVIDKKGIIRYKQIGPVSQEIWDETLKPLINKLEHES